GFAFGVLALDQVRATKRLAERPPEFRLQSSDRHEAPVGALVHAVARVATGQAVHAAWDGSLGADLGQWDGEPAERTAGHGDGQVPPFTATRDREEGAQDGGGSGLPTATDVGDLDGERMWSLAPAAVH